MRSEDYLVTRIEFVSRSTVNRKAVLTWAPSGRWVYQVELFEWSPKRVDHVRVAVLRVRSRDRGERDARTFIVDGDVPPSSLRDVRHLAERVFP